MAQITLKVTTAPGILIDISIFDNELLKAVNTWDEKDKIKFISGIDFGENVNTVKIIAGIVNDFNLVGLTKEQLLILHHALSNYLEKIDKCIK